MLKKIFSVALFLVFATQLFALCGCGKDEDKASSAPSKSESHVSSVASATASVSQPDVVEKITDQTILLTYLNKDLIGKYGLAKNNILTKSSDGISGMVSACFCDINADGVMDMLTTQSLGGNNAELKTDVYTVEGGKITEPASVVSGEEEFANVYGNNDVFLKKNASDGSYYICIKNYNTSSFSGSISEQYFTVYQYGKDRSITKLVTLRCSDENANAVKLYIDNEAIFACNSLGTAKAGYACDSFDSAAKAMIDKLSQYGLDDKVYTEMSGNEIIAVTFEGFNSKADGEISVSYRNEAIGSDYTTLQIQLNDRTGLKDLFTDTDSETTPSN